MSLLLFSALHLAGQCGKKKVGISTNSIITGKKRTSEPGGGATPSVKPNPSPLVNSQGMGGSEKTPVAPLPNMGQPPSPQQSQRSSGDIKFEQALLSRIKEWENRLSDALREIGTPLDERLVLELKSMRGGI
ncbi:MAG: hypothetical protein NQ127_00935 [Candidatus Cardinium sp.]|nr:hypothetical protein [Candidatus Cardinium sp.]